MSEGAYKGEIIASLHVADDDRLLQDMFRLNILHI